MSDEQDPDYCYTHKHDDTHEANERTDDEQQPETD